MLLTPLEIDLNHVRSQISGISPKLGLYKELKEKEARILKRLGHSPSDPYQRCVKKGCNNIGASRGYKMNIIKRSNLCSGCKRRAKKKS